MSTLPRVSVQTRRVEHCPKFALLSSMATRLEVKDEALSESDDDGDKDNVEFWSEKVAEALEYDLDAGGMHGVKADDLDLYIQYNSQHHLTDFWQYLMYRLRCPDPRNMKNFKQFMRGQPDTDTDDHITTFENQHRGSMLTAVATLKQFANLSMEKSELGSDAESTDPNMVAPVDTLGSDPPGRRLLVRSKPEKARKPRGSVGLTLSQSSASGLSQSSAVGLSRSSAVGQQSSHGDDREEVSSSAVGQSSHGASYRAVGQSSHGDDREEASSPALGQSSHAVARPPWNRKETPLGARPSSSHQAIQTSPLRRNIVREIWEAGGALGNRLPVDRADRSRSPIQRWKRAWIAPPMEDVSRHRGQERSHEGSRRRRDGSRRRD